MKEISIEELKKEILQEKTTCIQCLKNSERKRYIDYYAGKIHALDNVIQIIEKLKL